MNNVGMSIIPLYDFNYHLQLLSLSHLRLRLGLHLRLRLQLSPIPSCKKHPIDGGSANMINYTEITPGD